jgi:hypothetical protein
MPLHRRYKTAQQQLRHPIIRGTVYTDTFKSKVISTRNNEWAQLYTNGMGWVFVYPMQRKSDASASLKALFNNFGVPQHIHADNAPELQ